MTQSEAELAFAFFDHLFFDGALKDWQVRLEAVDAGGDRGTEINPADPMIVLDEEEIEDQGEDIFEVLIYAMAHARLTGLYDGHGYLWRNLMRRLYQQGAPVDSADFGRDIEYEAAPAEPLGI
jgi:hypothetical protein